MKLNIDAVSKASRRHTEKPITDCDAHLFAYLLEWSVGTTAYFKQSKILIKLLSDDTKFHQSNRDAQSSQLRISLDFVFIHEVLGPMESSAFSEQPKSEYLKNRHRSAMMLNWFARI